MNMKKMGNKLKLLWILFLTYFKIGLFTFGGGYAMISLIERETTKKGWMSEDDMIDMVSLAESTPGVIAVNSATFVGCKMAGFWGALMATIGVVLPSFIIISSLFFVLEAFLLNTVVAWAFKGIRACVAVLILNVSIKLFAQLPRNAYTYIVLVGVFAIVTFTKVSGIWLILFCALLGVLYVVIKSKKQSTTQSAQQTDNQSTTQSAQKDEELIDTDKENNGQNFHGNDALIDDVDKHSTSQKSHSSSTDDE